MQFARRSYPDRKFNPGRPNEAWAGDVTYVATGEGWLDLAILLDLFSRPVISWALSNTNDRVLALEALNQAMRLRHPPRGLIIPTAAAPTRATTTALSSRRAESSRA